jgi:cobalt-zinc-cadmium efflux system protein
MESAPGHVDLEDLSQSMLEAEGVLAVHDLHVWTITSGLISMSGHVTINKETNPEGILDSLNHILKHDFGIAHTTIQLETDSAAKRCNDICAIS